MTGYAVTATAESAFTPFLLHPLRIFVSASMLFGVLLIAATPPLRGPDETAHFLRAYGIAAGDLIPSIHDAHGRKGVFLPAPLYAGFDYFESVRIKEKDATWQGYLPEFAAYARERGVSLGSGAEPVFVAYGGSEGYSPGAYLPQIAAALVARLLGLDFLSTFYLMRLAGLSAMTALIGFGITLVPPLAWAFVGIAMLPAALYGRAVINADGAALAAAIVVAALWVRCALLPHTCMLGRQSLWMAINALTKPANLALALLLMGPSPTGARVRWRWGPISMLPAIAGGIVWSLCSGADTAAWRMVEQTGQESAAFDPVLKLFYLIDHPMHFLSAVAHMLAEKSLDEIWRQLIGVLGLFDTVLADWVYPVLTTLLFGTFLAGLPAAPMMRRAIAIAAATTAAAYVLAILLICYLTFTPADADSVWGIQGRYFVPILPLVAIVTTTLCGRGLNDRTRAMLALTLTSISGIASLAAVLANDWKIAW